MVAPSLAIEFDEIEGIKIGQMEIAYAQPAKR